MANLINLVMNPADEVTFLNFLERYKFEVYPRRIPADWKPFFAASKKHDQLPEREIYLNPVDIGPVVVDKIKRGPDNGYWRVDEVKCPVIFWERSVLDEENRLLSGQLWAELDITPQTGRRTAAADQFRSMFLEIEGWIRKNFRKGNPKPFLVGPNAARQVKEGSIKLWDDTNHWGGDIKLV